VIPETVKEVIGRRLDRLSGACRRVLVLASVIGRDFDLDTLSTIAERSPDEL
jgi:predicted ATPase